MTENRDHRNYYGFTKTITDAKTGLTLTDAFLAMSSVTQQLDRIIFNYDAWNDGIAFDNWKEPVSQFTKYYSFDPIEYPSLVNANTNLFAAVDAKYRELCGVSGAAEFKSAFISPRTWSLRIEFFEDNEEKIFAPVSSKYNDLIQANLMLVGGLVQIGHGRAFDKDPAFWAGAVLIEPVPEEEAE